eukprot:3270533-Rhodomonas_salina.3
MVDMRGQGERAPPAVNSRHGAYSSLTPKKRGRDTAVTSLEEPKGSTGARTDRVSTARRLVDSTC